MVIDRIKREFTSRSFERGMLAVTGLGIACFTLFLLFTSLGVAIRISSVTSVPAFILGFAILAIGFLVRRAGYLVFGLSIVICGIANQSIRASSDLGSLGRLWFGLLALSDLVCVASLAVQWREWRR